MSARRRWQAPAVALAALILAACGETQQLKQLKTHASAGDYTWVAQQPVTCLASTDGCNQQHLVKGDACYRLAKQGVEAHAHYECAANELETGIQQTKVWREGNLDLGRAQTYENLCESLRNWQDLERGAEADRLTQRLASSAQEFLAAEPGNPAAIYFLNSARFTELHGDLLHPRDPRAVCGSLNAILESLGQHDAEARGTRYAANFARLTGDVTGAKRAVPGCG